MKFKEYLESKINNIDWNTLNKKYSKLCEKIDFKINEFKCYFKLTFLRNKENEWQKLINEFINKDIKLFTEKGFNVQYKNFTYSKILQDTFYINHINQSLLKTIN